MFKRISILILVYSVFFTNIASSEEWIAMGTAYNFPNLKKQELKNFNKYVYYYDAESLVVNREEKSIEVTYIRKPEKRANDSSPYKFHHVRINFASNPINSNFYLLSEGTYKMNTNEYTRLFEPSPRHPSSDKKWYPGMTRYKFPIDPINCNHDKNYLFYREFSPMLNLPNLDGTKTPTPRDLGLIWIKSTSKIGVFYDPNSIKVKDRIIEVDIYILKPSENRMEILKGKYDYNKNTFFPKEDVVYRMNTMELTERYTNSFLFKLPSFTFNENEIISIAAEAFKTMLTK